MGRIKINGEIEKSMADPAEMKTRDNIKLWQLGSSTWLITKENAGNTPKATLIEIY